MRVAANISPATSSPALAAPPSEPQSHSPLRKQGSLLYVKVSAFDGEASATFVVDQETTGWHLLARMIHKSRVEYPLVDRLRLYHLGRDVATRIDYDDLVFTKLSKESPPYELVMRPAQAIAQSLVARLESDLFFSAWFTKRYPSFLPSEQETEPLDQQQQRRRLTGNSGLMRRSMGLLTFTIPTSLEEDFEWYRDVAATLRLRVRVSDYAETEWLLSFNPKESVLAAAQRLLVLFKLSKDTDQFCFFTAEGTWLDPGRCLEHYGLKEGSLLTFDKVYATYKIALPDAEGTTVSINFPHNVKAAALKHALEHNYASLLGGQPAEQFGLFIPGELDEVLSDHLLSDHAYSIVNVVEYRLRKQPLSVFMAGRKETLHVDYLAPLGFAQDELCALFGIPSTSKFVLQPLLTIGSNDIDLSSSLAQQGVQPPATLALLVDRQGQQAIDGPSSPPLFDHDDLDGAADPDHDELHQQKRQLLLQRPSSSSSSSSSWTHSPVCISTSDQFLDVEPQQGQRMGRLVTRPQLVFKVLSEHSGKVQRVFLATYPHVMSHGELCASLVGLYQNAVDEDFKQTVVEFIGDLTFNRGAELRSDVGAAQGLIEFLQFTILPETSLAPMRQLAQLCIRRLTAPTSSTISRHAPPFEELVDTLTPEQKESYLIDPSLFAIPEAELAQCITSFDQSIFQFMTINELACLARGSNHGSQQQQQSQQNCQQQQQQQGRTILAMISRFNALASWVAFLILEPRSPKERAQRFEYLVKVAESLRRLNNFQSLMAFISGFHSSPVARLNSTRQYVSPSCLKLLNSLSDLMKPDGNWAVYRAALAQAKSPIVPFIGNYLGDLTFAFDGNPTFVEGKVNWGKLRLIFKIVANIPTFQKGYLPRPSPPNILGFVSPLPLFTTDTLDSFLFARSLAREPRGQQAGSPLGRQASV